MKRYQVAILSFAFGIFTLAISLGWLLESKDRANTPDYIRNNNEPVTARIFFPNKIRDPEGLYCDQTYPVEREILQMSDNAQSKLGEFAYLVLNELLKGPAGEEKKRGFFTSINADVKIQKIIIENSIAKVDFNEELDKGVAGSCRVVAIRSQITETLRQFSEVKEIIISVNGRTDDILQP